MLPPDPRGLRPAQGWREAARAGAAGGEEGENGPGRQPGHEGRGDERRPQVGEGAEGLGQMLRRRPTSVWEIRGGWSLRQGVRKGKG